MGRNLRKKWSKNTILSLFFEHFRNKTTIWESEKNKYLLGSILLFSLVVCFFEYILSFLRFSQNQLEQKSTILCVSKLDSTFLRAPASITLSWKKIKKYGVLCHTDLPSTIIKINCQKFSNDVWTIWNWKTINNLKFSWMNKTPKMVGN